MPILEAPSGLAGDVRKIKGGELIKLAESADDTGPDGGFGAMISACWLRTTDAGPYSFVQVGDTKPDWQRMLKGDALYAFVFLRQISMGDDYDFDVQCEECKKRYGWTLRLSELPVRKLSEKAAEHFRSGEPFETTVAGRTVRFALGTIAQEGPITKLMKKQKREVGTMVDTLCAQTISIEGVNPDINARHRWLSDLDLDELHELRAAFDEHDCGIETLIQTRCTKRTCRWEQDINLPLGKTFFARPRRRPTEEEHGMASSSEDSSEDSTSSGSGSSSTTSSGISTAGAATP